jgi:hypothetical protein
MQIIGIAIKDKIAAVQREIATMRFLTRAKVSKALFATI